MAVGPVEGLVPFLDVPSKDPGMGFQMYAEVLASLIRSADPPQMTIGIFGGYGTGKTTLMDAIAENLKDDVRNGSIVTIGFNAWRHDHEEHLFLPLLNTVYQSVKNVPSLSKCVAAAFWGFVQGLSLSLSHVEVSVGTVYESLRTVLAKNDLSEALAGYVDVYDGLSQIPYAEKANVTRRMVIFIDDLDRCVPQRAFALLEAVKSFMDIRGFVFVLGLDPRAIRTYLSRKYDDAFCVTAEEYLQKMVQIPVHLPRFRRADVIQHLSESSDVAKSLLADTADLQEFLPCNLRQVKRLLNMYTVIKATSDELARTGSAEVGSLNSRILLGLLIIESQWPLAYYVLHSYRDRFHDVYRSCTGKDSSHGPRVLTEKRRLINELASDGFGKIYSFIFEALGKDLTGICRYLDLMGWPILEESDLSLDDERPTGGAAPPS
ncbi:MAG: P-loop NTPase fold protein [Phycisphaerales bacterium]